MHVSFKTLAFVSMWIAMSKMVGVVVAYAKSLMSDNAHAEDELLRQVAIKSKTVVAYVEVWL